MTMDPKPPVPESPPVCTQKARCRLSHVGGGISTCMAWAPEYDGYGNLINRDPNTHSDQITCRACGGSWWKVQESGATTWSAVNAEGTVAEKATNVAEVNTKGTER